MKAFFTAIAEAVAKHPTIQQILKNQNIIMSDQTKLDTDVAAITQGFVSVITELKAQRDAAVAAGTPVPLDFTKADALVASIQAEATADAPSVATPAVPSAS